MAILFTPEKPGRSQEAPVLRFERSCLVLVEGSDDQAVIGKIANSEGITDIQIHDMGGNTKWPDSLRAIAKDDSFNANVSSLGLVRDADKTPSGCFTSCSSAVTGAGLLPPEKPGEFGPGNPCVGVAIVPTSKDLGALEELCIASFSTDRMSCVSSYFECVGRLGHLSAPSSKAKVQVYLAGLGVKHRSIAVAVESGTINISHPAFNELRSFVKDLYEKSQPSS